MDSDITITDSPRDIAVHSYPPTSPPETPLVIVRPPSPRAVHAKLEEIAPVASSSSPSATSPILRPPRSPYAPITHFLLTPHSTAHVPRPTESVSVFTRMLSVLKNNAPSHSYSFTLSPIPTPPTPVPESPNAGNHQSHGAETHIPVPILTFHDRTPVWTVRSNSGYIEVDKTQVRTLGVETSFYIAIALTYFEFLEDRESYLAALND